MAGRSINSSCPQERMNNMNKGEGCPQVPERETIRFDTPASSGSRLDLQFDPAHLSGQTEIKVMKYQCRRKARGLPYIRRRGKQQLCTLAPDGNLASTSEPTPKSLTKPKRNSWRIALDDHRDIQFTQLELEEPSTSKGKCASTSNVVTTGKGRASTACDHGMNCEQRACPAHQHDEVAVREAGELGRRRKAQRKRKNMEPCEKNCLKAAAMEQKQKKAALHWALEEKQRQRLHKQREGCRKRLVKEQGHPLKRTYGATKVNKLCGASHQNNLLSKCHGPEGPASLKCIQDPHTQLQNSNNMCLQVWKKEHKQEAKPRERACPVGQFEKMLRRSGCRYSVSLSDAQTQTDSVTSCQCCYSEPSTPEDGSRTSTHSPARECASHNSSQTSGEGSSSSSSSSQDSSQMSLGEGTSKRSCQPSECCSDGQQAVGESTNCVQPFGAELEFPAPSLDRTRTTAPGERRRIPSTMTTQALTCAKNPRRRRRVATRGITCRPQHSQDNWGCLIF